MTKRNEHVLRCNGVVPDRRRAVRGGQWDLWTFGSMANVRLKVADITDAMGRKLPAQAVDLLELASLVYAADQYCGRTPGRRFDYGAKWRRALRFEVAVRRPDFWKRPAVHAALVETLHFLSEDDYEFAFAPMPSPPPVQDYLEFGGASVFHGPVDQVLLMSGGLDSLAGAVEQVLRHRRRTAMVSHRPVGHLAKRQRELVRAVGKRGKDKLLRPFHVAVTAHKVGLEEQDVTQRSRSFLYAAMGAAVAHLFGLSEVWFYENGVTSVNLPLCAQEVGGHATRTTHPQVLRGFERLFSLVFNGTFGVPNGFLWHTKQDVVEVLKRHAQADLALDSVSCSHTRDSTHASPHCGMCSQCLSRRVATLGAMLGVDDPAEGYRLDPMLDPRARDEERILAERFVGQARLVERMRAVEQFNQKYAGELARVYPYLNMPTADAASKLYDLHRRHAEQVGGAVITMMEEHAGGFWRGELSETSALSYAFGDAKRTGRGKKNTTTADQAENAATPKAVTPINLRLDEETFTATYIDAGGVERRCTLAGRFTKQFALLARIAKLPGRRVAFDDLRQPGEVFGDSRAEDSSIRGAVFRLKGSLIEAGLRDVASAISTCTFDRRAFVAFGLARSEASAA